MPTLPNYSGGFGSTNSGPSWTIPNLGLGNAFGSVPAPVQLPNPQQNLSAVYPNLSGATGQAAGDVMGELRGQLSPETVAGIQQQAAQWGVANGVPGSALATNTGLRSIGLNTEQLQHQGLGDFLNLSSGLTQTQTLAPALQAEIEANNNLMASAPNPSLAADALGSAYNKGAGSAGAGRLTLPPPPTSPGITGSTTGTGGGSSPLDGMFYNGVWYPTGSAPSGGGLQWNPSTGTFNNQQLTPSAAGATAPNLSGDIQHGQDLLSSMGLDTTPFSPDIAGLTSLDEWDLNPAPDYENMALSGTGGEF